MKRLSAIVLICIAVSGCVSMKKYDSLKADAMRMESEIMSANANNQSLSARLDKMTQERQSLVADSARMGSEIRSLKAKCGQLNAQYETLLTEGSAEAGRMLRQLEDNQRELEMREKRLGELEQLLAAREEALKSIRNKVADALLGFEGKGLTVTQRDGKVYVSMDDKLLFKSGSFDIDPNGAKAVKDLGVVLAQNPDINVMVEGHTDDVPYRAKDQLQDNLDLSAKRATTVTRLLLENKGIKPERIIAAGRGESLPVAQGKSAEARARNRRTEIILTPKLDELAKLM